MYYFTIIMIFKKLFMLYRFEEKLKYQDLVYYIQFNNPKYEKKLE